MNGKQLHPVELIMDVEGVDRPTAERLMDVISELLTKAEANGGAPYNWTGAQIRAEAKKRIGIGPPEATDV